MSEELSPAVLPYVEKAKGMGIDVEDVMVLHQLVQALRYVDARLHARNAGYNFMEEMCAYTGQSRETLMLWAKSPYITVASQMIGDKIIEKLMESDVRKNIMDVYSKDSLEWFQNMSRIAKGVKATGARSAPLERDQIDAFEALTQSEMGQIYTRMLFLDPDDRDVTPQDLHLARQNELRGKVVKIESTIVDAEIVKLEAPKED
jgi:hypothetical protein